MSDTDVAFRTNIITLAGDGAYEDLIIKDHSSGDITTEEADQLIKAVNEAFADEKLPVLYGNQLQTLHDRTQWWNRL